MVFVYTAVMLKTFVSNGWISAPVPGQANMAKPNYGLLPHFVYWLHTLRAILIDK